MQKGKVAVIQTCNNDEIAASLSGHSLSNLNQQCHCSPTLLFIDQLSQLKLRQHRFSGHPPQVQVGHQPLTLAYKITEGVWGLFAIKLSTQAPSKESPHGQARLAVIQPISLKF